MRPRIYTDTSVIGGCEDQEFAEYSLRLMSQFGSGDSILALSNLTLRELDTAPAAVRRHLAAVPEANIELLFLDEEAQDLANSYLEAGVVSARMKSDAQHIAIATTGRVDVLVSWNFKHIVNLQRIQGYNSVNLRQGYPLIEIRTPREVLTDD